MPEHAPDAGFSLVEVIVAIALISVVMGAVTTFLVTTLSGLNQQRSKQTAVQLASSGIERVRALKSSSVASGQAGVVWDRTVPGVARYLKDMNPVSDPMTTPPTEALLPTIPEPVQVNGVAYLRYWYVGECWQPRTGGGCGVTKDATSVKLLRVVVAVTWPGPERYCGRTPCSYLTSTLVSAALDEPVFNPNRAEPPKIINPGNQAGDVGVEVSPRLQLSASGGERPSTWAIESGLPAGLSMSPSGLIAGTPGTGAVGTHTVIVAVTDTAGIRVTDTFTWAVNALPRLTKPADQTSAVGNAVSLPIPLIGGTGPLTWQAAGLPPGLSIDAATGAVTGIPTAVAPAENVTVTVTDKFAKSDSTTFRWTVIPRPTITSPTGTRVDTVGDVVSLWSTATGGTGRYTWSATNLPAGLSMDPTGLISGTIAAGTRYLSTVTVTDQAGAAHSVTIEWTVNNPDGLRVTAPAVDRSGVVGQSVTITMSAAGGNISRYAWSATGLPPDVTLTDGATMSGIPMQAGSYTVTLTVRDGTNPVATFMFTWTIR